MKLQIGLNDVTLTSYADQPLIRAVIISLFSWRLADPDDDVQEGDRHGWWGDTYAEVEGDLTGSRLWELLRHTITEETLAMARQFAEEALQWLIDDRVAESVIVDVERGDLNRIDMRVDVIKPTKEKISIRFQDVWENI